MKRLITCSEHALVVTLTTGDTAGIGLTATHENCLIVLQVI